MIMDYEEAYKEAIKRAKAMIKVANNQEETYNSVITIFPELKESEDEKIRKEILDYIDKSTGCKRWVDWIEKQGEQKPINDTDEDIVKAVKDTSILDMIEFNVGDWITSKSFGNTVQIKRFDNEGKVWFDNGTGIFVNFLKDYRLATEDEIQQKIKFKVGDIVQLVQDNKLKRKIVEIDYNRGLYFFENGSTASLFNQDMWELVQKPADMGEPKFHKNDWVVNNNSGNVYQVTEIRDDEYCLWPLDGEIMGYLRIIDVDNDYHLWTIQDAKDGDVLCVKYGNDEMPFIFTGKQDDVAYCALNSFGEFVLSIAEWLVKTTSVFPAIKEQRDTLMNAMLDAGYTFDFEKKELKEIEYKPADEIDPIDFYSMFSREQEQIISY